MRPVCAPVHALSVLPLKLRKVHDLRSWERCHDPRPLRFLGRLNQVVDREKYNEKRGGAEAEHVFEVNVEDSDETVAFASISVAPQVGSRALRRIGIARISCGLGPAPGSSSSTSGHD